MTPAPPSPERSVLARHRGELPGRQRGPVTTVVVPAHNEADGIVAMVDSLLAQTRMPDRVLVVADNCTDDTVGTVSRLVVNTPLKLDVFTTVDNRHKKAGALNQALRYMFRGAIDDDMILVMDADSVLAPTWIESALETMPEGSTVKAVSGMCRGDNTPGIPARLQRMEYEQIAAQRTRKAGATRMLSGAGSAFRVRTLREVADARERTLPGRHGDVYNAASLTEDHELTLAIRTLGWRITSPTGCGVRTQLLSSWRGLAAQRIRWDRGGIADLFSYGFNRATVGQFGYLAERVLGLLVHALVVSLVVFALASGAELVFHWWAIGFAVLAAVPAIAGVRRLGARYMLVAGLIVPQFAYYLYLEVVAVAAYWRAVRGAAWEWKH